MVTCDETMIFSSNETLFWCDFFGGNTQIVLRSQVWTVNVKKKTDEQFGFCLMKRLESSDETLGSHHEHVVQCVCVYVFVFQITS